MSIVNHFRIENVMHVLDPFFFQIKSLCWKTLHIKVLVVIFDQTGFALKIALKC